MEKKQDFQSTIFLNGTPESVFHAISAEIPQWWTSSFEGSSSKPGSIFTIRFGPSVYKTIEVVELVNSQKIVWRVIDSSIDIPALKRKNEWNDTIIVWEILYNDQTAIRITHLGLHPDVECYQICEAGWNGFLKSLTDFIQTGKGSPFKLSE